MHLRDLLTEDRAVSPVIGVILMVAITVILAAVIGTFVLGIGQDQQTTPSAAFDFEKFEKTSSQPDELKIFHDGGDSIDNEQLFVTANVQVQEESGSPGPADRLSWAQLGDGGDEVQAGDSVFVEPPNSDRELDDKVFRVVWESDSGGETQILATWEGSQT